MSKCILSVLFIGGLLTFSPAQADFDQAMNAYRAGDFAAAFTGFQELARQGDHTAQHNIAVMYYRGEGVSKSRPHAYAWMLLAAQGEDSEILRAHHVLMILSDPGSVEAGRQLARRFASENGLTLEDHDDLSGLRVVSDR